MSAQEMTFTIQLDDGSLAEARVWDAKSAEAMRKAVESPKPLRVKAAPPADTAGHELANDTLAVTITLEGDVEGHTMILRLPSAQEAREFQKRLLITGVLAASLVVGAAGANLAMQQQAGAVAQAGPAVTYPTWVDPGKDAPAISVSAPATQVRTNPVTPATIDSQLRDSSAASSGTSVISPAKDAKDAQASGGSSATDSGTDTSPSGPGSRTTFPQ
jgi:hypothetical protein